MNMSIIIIILNNFRIMLSQKAINYFQENWYSFEEIEGIKEWLLQSKNWETISHAEMKKFVSNELFSKYKSNV